MTPADVVAAVTVAIGAAWLAVMIALSPMFAFLRVGVLKIRWNALYHVLTECQFCLASHLALAGTALYRPRLVDLWWPIDLLVAWGATAGLAVLLVAPLRRQFMHGKKPIVQGDTK